MLDKNTEKKLGQVRLPSQNQVGTSSISSGPGGAAAPSAPASEPFYHIYAFCNNGQNPTDPGASSSRFTIGNQYVDPPGSAMWVFGTSGMGSTKWEISTMGNYTYNIWLNGTSGLGGPLPGEFFRVEQFTQVQYPTGLVTWYQGYYGVPPFPGCGPPTTNPGYCYDRCYQYLGNYQCGDVMVNGETLPCYGAAPQGPGPAVHIISDPILFISDNPDPLPHVLPLGGAYQQNMHLPSCSACDGQTPPMLYECVPAATTIGCECLQTAAGTMSNADCWNAIFTNDPACCPAPPIKYICSGCQCIPDAAGTMSLTQCQSLITAQDPTCCPPPPTYYSCAGCQCAPDPLGTLTLAQCQNLITTNDPSCCSPDLYICDSCTCTQSPIGTLSLSQCQNLVATQDASCCPPDFYECAGCHCTQSATGTLSLTQCQQLITAQDPTCCPLIELYTCANCTCTLSSSGTLTFAQCQQLIATQDAECCPPPRPRDETKCLPALTKEEFLMNVCQKPETRSDVFIERGKVSVFERCQRLAVNPTIGELELHGYGYYKFENQS